MHVKLVIKKEGRLGAQTYLKYLFVANAAMVGPMIIATAIKAAALDISPLIPKMSIPQLAIPNAKTAKIIAMIKPTTLTSNSIAVTGLFSFSDIQIPDRSIFLIKHKTFCTHNKKKREGRVVFGIHSKPFIKNGGIHSQVEDTYG
jgi:hypothetical protein